MAQDFEVAVYTTRELYDHCSTDGSYGFEARDIAKDIIEGAANRWKHSIAVNLGDTIVDAPQENKGGPFEAYAPCTSKSGTWNDLRDWWEFWVKDADCKDPHASGKDCHVLLTNADGGGLGASRAAVVGGGFTVTKDLNGYEDYGYTKGHKRAKAILHEVGHNLTNNMENKDDEVLAHDSARIYDHTGNADHLPKEDNTISVMGIESNKSGADDTQNNCSDQTYWYTDKPKYYGTGDERSGWELRYSPCTEQNVEARPR